MTIKQRIVEITADELEIDSNLLKTDQDLRTRYNVDSLMSLQLVAAIETEFGILIDDEDLHAYTTIDVIADVVGKYVLQAA
jgi:acyl carrier protein